MLQELNRYQKEVTIYCDNNNSICLAKNPEFHSRSKHIDIRYHYIREKINDNELNIQFRPSEKMCADI